MPEIATVDATAEAEGHPVECQEPAPGSVVSTSDSQITVTVGGTTKEIASVDSDDINFPSHGHGTDEGACTDFQTHNIDPTVVAPDITINGSPVYVLGDAVGTDPTTGGDVNLIDNPIDTQITTP